MTDADLSAGWNGSEDGLDEEKTKELIKRERENGEFVKFEESETIDNIYKLIRTIRNTALMSDEEKEAAIAEIGRASCRERV